MDDGWAQHMSSLDPDAPIVLWRRTGYYLLPLSRPGDVVVFVGSGTIIGIGSFDYSVCLSLNEAWNDYATSLGKKDRGSFLQSAGLPAESDQEVNEVSATCRIVSNNLWLGTTGTLRAADLPTIKPGQPFCAATSQLGQSLLSRWQRRNSPQSGFMDGISLIKRADVPDGPRGSRPGQQRFQARIFKNLGSVCIVSGETAALTAAHIHRFAHSGNHDVTNGLPLRSDLHILFDCGYWTIDYANRIRFSPVMLKDHPRTSYVRQFNGRKLEAIEVAPAIPDAAALEWHRINVYMHDED